MDEILINIKPVSDFEKLVWERAANKELIKRISILQIEIGKLKSEIDELKYLLSKNNHSEWKYQCIKIAHHKVQLRLRDARKNVSDLTNKLCTLKATNYGQNKND